MADKTVLKDLFLDKDYDNFIVVFMSYYYEADELGKLALLRSLLTKWRSEGLLTKVNTLLGLTL